MRFFTPFVLLFVILAVTSCVNAAAIEHNDAKVNNDALEKRLPPVKATENLLAREHEPINKRKENDEMEKRSPLLDLGSLLRHLLGILEERGAQDSDAASETVVKRDTDKAVEGLKKRVLNLDANVDLSGLTGDVFGTLDYLLSLLPIEDKKRLQDSAIAGETVVKRDTDGDNGMLKKRLLNLTFLLRILNQLQEEQRRAQDPTINSETVIKRNRDIKFDPLDKREPLAGGLLEALLGQLLNVNLLNGLDLTLLSRRDKTKRDEQEQAELIKREPLAGGLLEALLGQLLSVNLLNGLDLDILSRRDVTKRDEHEQAQLDKREPLVGGFGLLEALLGQLLNVNLLNGLDLDILSRRDVAKGDEPEQPPLNKRKPLIGGLGGGLGGGGGLIGVDLLNNFKLKLLSPPNPLEILAQSGALNGLGGLLAGGGGGGSSGGGSPFDIIGSLLGGGGGGGGGPLGIFQSLLGGLGGGLGKRDNVNGEQKLDLLSERAESDVGQKSSNMMRRRRHHEKKANSK